MDKLIATQVVLVSEYKGVPSADKYVGPHGEPLCCICMEPFERMRSTRKYCSARCRSKRFRRYHRPTLVYVSGPISASSKRQVKKNLRRFSKVARELSAAGFAAVTPREGKGIPYETLLREDFATLRACAAVYRLPGLSPGADREVRAARRWRIPIVYNLVELKDVQRRRTERSIHDDGWYVTLNR